MKSLKRDFIFKLLSNWEQNQENQAFYNNRLNYLNENFQRLNQNAANVNVLEIQNLFLNYYNFTCELLAFKINSFFYKKRENNLNLNQKFLDLLKDGDVFYLEKCLYILSFVLKDKWIDQSGQQNRKIESFINKYGGIWLIIRNYLSSSHSFNPYPLNSEIEINGIKYNVVNEISEMNELVNNLNSESIKLYDEINSSDKTILNSFDYFDKKCLKIFTFITETKKWIDGKKSKYDSNDMNLVFPKKGDKDLNSQKVCDYLNSLCIYIILNIDEFYYNANIIQYWVTKINQQKIYDFLFVFFDNTSYYNQQNNQNDLFFFKLSSDNNVRLFDFISQVLRNGNNNNNKYTFFDKLKNYFFNANNNNNSFFNSSLNPERKNSYDFSIAAAFFKSELIDYFLSNYFSKDIANKYNELFNFYKNIFLRSESPGIPFNLWKLEKKMNEKIPIKEEIGCWSNILECCYYFLYKNNEKEILYKRFSKKWGQYDNYSELFPSYYLLNQTIIYLENNNNINEITEELKSKKIWPIELLYQNNLKIEFVQFYLEDLYYIKNKYNLKIISDNLFWTKHFSN